MTCGSGNQARLIKCLQAVKSTNQQTDSVLVPDANCPRPPPFSVRACNLVDCPPAWTVDKWTQVQYCLSQICFQCFHIDFFCMVTEPVGGLTVHLKTLHIYNNYGTSLIKGQLKHFYISGRQYPKHISHSMLNVNTTRHVYNEQNYPSLPGCICGFMPPQCPPHHRPAPPPISGPDKSGAHYLLHRTPVTLCL